MKPELKKDADRLYFALDVDTREDAEELIAMFGGKLPVIKVNSVFTMMGEYVVKRIISSGSSPFVDTKIHDVKDTSVRHAIALGNMGAKIITLHSVVDSEVMKAIMEALNERYGETYRPFVLAITVLTSINQKTLNDEIGIPGLLLDSVVRLARLAKESGVDGVVCSGHETRAIREACGDDFFIVNPGIRFSGKQEGGQKRVVTPFDAISSGADAIVMGSDLRKGDPRENVQSALDEIHSALIIGKGD